MSRSLVSTAAPRLDAHDIEREFDRTASRYDLMVGLNRGYHDHLRAAAGSLADSVARRDGAQLVDLGCGSGASTAALVGRFADRAPVELLGLDASGGMIERAEAKRWPAWVRFAHRPAEQLSAVIGDAGGGQPLDGVLACYLFRNVDDPDAVLADVFAALRPGGTLVVQDYTLRDRRRAAVMWSIVCWLVVVPLSLALTRRTRLYRYLWRSVLDFDSPDRFAQRLRDAGFAPVSTTTVRGWQAGILHTFVAHRP